MAKKYVLSVLALLLLIAFVSSANATPPAWDGGLVISPPAWQWEDMWGNDDYNGNPQKKLKKEGCLVTAFGMLFKYHGLQWIPDADHYPVMSKLTNPGTLNKWLTENNIYEMYADKKTNKRLDVLDPITPVKSFYYFSWDLDGWYIRVKPENNCAPFTVEKEIKTKKGKKQVTRTSDYSCFDVPYSDKAETYLNNDLESGNPDVMKIEWWATSGTYHDSHFVLIGGYDQKFSSYRAYDPNQRYDSVPPPGLKRLYTEPNSQKRYNPLKIWRYSELYSAPPPNMSRLTCWVYSPVEIQITNADGLATGYDPETGTNLGDNPNALYYEDVEPTIDDTTEPSERVKTLYVDEPSEGNYILKIFGTGDGPYTVVLNGSKEDGSSNLSTAITGTAYPGLYQIYRIKYSPTGEASLSQDNQPPVANAGTEQKVEQGEKVTLDASASSDPDGDPITYKWTFQSKPDGSMAALSDANAVNPSFTADKAGTYVLQLVVNDQFIDSMPSFVKITSSLIKSQIAVTPNFTSPLATGSTTISFNVNNIGRVGISSGAIDLNIKGPDGVVVYTGSQSFSIDLGESKVVNISATLPPLKFGLYALTYTQSDETRIGAPTTVSISNAVALSFAFDKISYRARESANVVLALMNIGKFNQDNLTLTVSVPDAGYSDTRSVSLGAGPNPTSLNYVVSLPESIAAGQHALIATLSTTTGSSVVQSTKFAVPESVLAIGNSGPSSRNAGDTIALFIENTGGVDTSYTSQQFLLTDSKGGIVFQNDITGSIMAGERKTLAEIQIPSATASGPLNLSIRIQNNRTLELSSLYSPQNVTGLAATLVARTEKDFYSKGETITAISNLLNGQVGLEGGNLKLAVHRINAPGTGQFALFLPKEGWGNLNAPSGIATGFDGSIYVADTSNQRVQKFSSNGDLITTWGSHGTGNGQFTYPTTLAVSADGFVYVVDSDRVQKFDSNGQFIAAWGSYCETDSNHDKIVDQACEGQFNSPQGIAVSADGFVYVADTGNVRIEKFNANGGFITSWGAWETGEFWRPQGIAAGADGYVYVIDEFRIQKFDGNGGFIAKWGTYGNGDGQFNFPQGLAIAADNSIYVADTWNSRIQQFTAQGQFISKWGVEGYAPGQLANPRGIAVGSDNIVYVLDSGNNRVQKFNSTGTFIKKWGSNYCITDTNGDRIPDQSCDGEFYHPFRVETDSEGYVFVVDSENHRIQKFDSNGNFITQWGSLGSGNGQFNFPYGIAISPDGYLYVADSSNNRIQKFDRSGNFITKWGGFGGINGNFSDPTGIAIAPDGAVYVADNGHCRIQKFDPDGVFITTWGSCGKSYWEFGGILDLSVASDGSVYVLDAGNARIKKFTADGWFLTMWGSSCQTDIYNDGIIDQECNGMFYGPQAITIPSDGTVYVADTWNQRIELFDSNGTFMKKWGGYGALDGQFNNPSGIRAGKDGAVYVADTFNNRIQKMTVSSGGRENLFETAITITQAQSASEDYLTTIGMLNSTGKFFLETTLTNSLGQTIASSEYPFYIVQGNTVLSFSADKKVYKPGETVTITGQVQNLAATDAISLNLSFVAQLGTQNSQQIYTETFDVPSGGTHQFSFTTTAGAEGTVTLTGEVKQNNASLVKIIDGYEVANPAVMVTVSGPDIVDRNPFDLTVTLNNTGKTDATIQYSASSSQGDTFDSQALTIAAGETRTLQYTKQIAKSTVFTVALSSDATQTASKTVVYGEAAAITIGSGGQGSSLYPEGKVTLPVTITNTGQVDETLAVTYQLSQGSGSQGQETRTYFLPKNGSATDTLTYTLSSGNYQLSAVSPLPMASAAATLNVAKANDVGMATVVGSLGTNGLIPVTAMLTNNGYNDINGTVQLSVLNNQQKNIWSGEVPVSGLKPQATGAYTINVSSTDMASGGYAGNNVLYSTSGQQLAANQAQIRVPGPSFDITALPSNLSFTVGHTATLTFSIKNTGTLSGTMSMAVQAMDLLNQTLTDMLNVGEEKAYTFSFQVPENADAADYLADYTLSGPSRQKGNVKFTVVGVNFGVTASTDKQVYNDGDTAALTLNITKQSQFDDGTYLVIIRYGTHHDIQTFTSSGQPSTVTFNVPLGTITGDRIFYGVYFQSGRKIYQNSLHINTPPTVALVSPTPNSLFNSTVNISANVTDGGLGIGAVEYQVDNGPWKALALTDPIQGQYTTTWIPVLADEGTHTLNLRATDQSGNPSKLATTKCTIDMTPPVTTITASAPRYASADGKLYVTSASMFTLSATDNLSGVANTEYRIDAGTWAAYAQFTLNSEGTHTIYYRSTDNVGNIEADKVLPVNIDNTPPISTSTVGTPQYTSEGTLYIGGSTPIILSAVDAGSGVMRTEYNIDSAGTYTTAVGPVNLAAYQDGTHTMNYWSVDNLGNTELSKNLTAVLDKTPPITTIAATDPISADVISTVSPTTRFILASTDSLSGVKTTSFSFDNGLWQTYMDAFSLSALPAGQHTIAYKSTDNVLNEETAKSITVRLISIDVTKKIDTSLNVLIGAWRQHSQDQDGKNDFETDDKQCEDCNTSLARLEAMLKSAGIAYYIPDDEEDFKASIRTGRYNAYLLPDFKEEDLGAELRESVYYGDGLLFIKTRPDDDPSLSDVFGVKFFGETSYGDLAITLTDSPISNVSTIETLGKDIVSIITATTAQSFGYVTDKRNTYPAIVFNQYGRGRVIMYTFDLLSSPDQVQAAALLINSLNYVRPAEHHVRALDSAPVRITLNNSSEPADIKMIESLPDNVSADTITPQGTQKDNTITWLKSLGGSEKANFGYYLNLPDIAGSYALGTELRYNNGSEFRLYDNYDLSLAIAFNSTDLLQNVITQLSEITTTSRKDAKKIEESIDKLQSIDGRGTRLETAQNNIQAIIEATEELSDLSIDISAIRLELDELLKIWEKKWSLSYVPRQKED